MKYKNFISILLVFGFVTVLHSQNDKKLIKKVDTYLKEQFKSDQTGCSVLISKKREVIYKKGFGLADLEMNVPNQPNTVFRLGSITKQFTAIAILQLVEKGELSLQDSIQKFIPDFPSKDDKITIEHLLTHTSGIKEYLSLDHPDPFVLRRDFLPKEIIDFFKNEPLDFIPGSKRSYSNSGYIILGVIIELVSGMNYEQYVEENLFEPSGMNNSYYDKYEAIIPNRAKGYEFQESKFMNSEFLSMTIAYAAGGLLSTVEDMYKWHQSLYSNKLVDNELLQKAFTSFKLNDGTETNYGYGWFIDNTINNKNIGHSGRISGFNSSEKYFVDDDLFVVVLCNLEDNGKSPTSIQALDKIVAILKGEKIKEVKVDEAILDSYKGLYTMEKDKSRIAEVKQKEGVFYIEEEGKWTSELLATSESVFLLNDINPKGTLEFIKDTNGKVIKLVVNQNGLYEWYKIE